MGAEKRRYRRKCLVFYLEVIDANLNQPLGKLSDITPDGIMLLMNREISKDEILPLKLNLPAKSGSSHSFSVEARCVWCKRNEPYNNYAAGFQFHNPNPEAVATIRSILGDAPYMDA